MPVAAQLDFYPIDSLLDHLRVNRPILTPNHRLARRIKLAWGRHQTEAGHLSWSTPRVMSLDNWWRSCYQQRLMQGDSLPGLLTAHQERRLWRKCVEECGEVPLLRPGAAAELAADAYRNLRLWNIDWRSRAQLFSFGEDTRLFLEWADRFEGELQRLGLAQLADLVPELARKCPQRQLVLAEFDDLPPLYRLALEAQAGEILHRRQPARQAECILQPCASHRAELDAAARWARDCYRQDSGQRIGILLPRLQAERLEIERILHREFDSDPRNPSSLPVNFSAGVALSSCGPVIAALGLLSLPHREMPLAGLGQILFSRYRSQGELSSEERAWAWLCEDACDPVQPSMFRGALARAGEKGTGQDRAAQEGAAREGAAQERAAQERAAQPQLARTLLDWGQGRRLRQKRAISEWPEVFFGLLDELGWPGPGPLDSIEYQQVEQFHRAVASLAELEPLDGHMDYSGALAALEQICSWITFQAQTPDAPIQVLGTLEAAGLQFDALWVCGMSAAEWPPAPSPNPFVPLQLQRSEGFPHADASRELAYATRILEHIGSSTARLVASYASLEDEVPTPPSPLVADFGTAAVLPDRPWPWSWDRNAPALRLEAVETAQAPAVSPAEAEAMRGGSAILRDQSQCPFRAFAYHRLRARPLPAAEPGLSAGDRGSILHDALYNLWGEIESSLRLKALDDSARAELVAHSAARAVESFTKGEGRHRPAGLLRLEQSRLEALLEQWLTVECQREDFVVAAREQRHAMSFGDLRITLRVDREDRLPDGRRLLVDYKTGDARVRSWLGARPEDPQLPLYTQLLDVDEVEGVSFAVLRHGTFEYRGLARSDQGPGIGTDIAKVTEKAGLPIADWDELQSHWQRTLERLAADFLGGHASVDPLDPRTTCKFCGLEALCRIR